MKIQILFFQSILCIGFSISSSAQNKNSIHASIFYPASIGDNFLHDLYRDVIGIDLGYQHFISNKIAIGPEYAVSLHNDGITFTDASGNIIGDDLITLFLHDFDAKGVLCINPKSNWQLNFAIASGYTLMNSSLNFPSQGKIKTHAGGFNITPSVNLNRKISDHLSVFASAGYSYKHLKNANLQSMNAGLGSAFLF